MSRNYDNWGRLVEAVMRREQYRQLSVASSISTTSYDSDFSSSSSSSYRYDDSYFTSSPVHTLAASRKLTQNGTGKVPVPVNKRTSLWRVLSVFKSNFHFKKVYGATEEKESGWANSRTFHGHEPMKTYSVRTESQIAQEANTKSELQRLQELFTLKGHIEALMKAKGLDSDSVNHYYTI